MLQYLLSLKPVNLNFRNIFLNAAVANNFQIISYLIDTLKVIKINEQDKFNRNALMFAYDNTNDETINYLLKKGIDINAKDTFGVNVFMRVCYICNMNLMKKLVNQKVRIKLKLFLIFNPYMLKMVRIKNQSLFSRNKNNYI